MKLPLIYYGHSLLRKKAQPVVEITKEIKKLIQDMLETMQGLDGLGIAAPQVGKSLAIFITAAPVEDGKGGFTQASPRVFINPKLSNPTEQGWEHSEACMSIPKLSGDVTRPVQITVTAQDINGKEFTEVFTGWPARVIMHENDHLNGVLFIDRIPQDQRKKMENALRKIKKQYNP